MRWYQRRQVWILLTAVALLLVAVTSAVIYVLLQQRTLATDWQDPVAAVTPDEIAPDLALYPLAGASELDTVDAAIVNGDLETAYAALAFGMEVTDAQRIGRQILLSDRFAEAEASDRATLCYQQIYDLAVLSPSLNDPARADALLAAGRGWATLGQEAEALAAYDQVYLIAVQSPYLHMANRRDLLAALELAYQDLGDSDRVDATRVKIIELDQETSPHPPAPQGEVPELPKGEAVVSSPEIGVLEEARRQAALPLVEVLAEGGEPPAGLVDGLAQALRAEDQGKLDLYSRELEATTQPGTRIEVSHQLIRWLMLKLKVAMQGFGLPLVPEWETEVADIQSALSKAHEGLYFDYEDLVTALPEASLIGPGRYEVRRQVLLEGRLGRYPNYPAQQLADKLQDAVGDLLSAGLVDPLYVDVEAEEGQYHFFLNPADEYGLADQAK